LKKLLNNKLQNIQNIDFMEKKFGKTPQINYCFYSNPFKNTLPLNNLSLDANGSIYPVYTHILIVKTICLSSIVG
jgi:hypothetical protein